MLDVQRLCTSDRTPKDLPIPIYSSKGLKIFEELNLLIWKLKELRIASLMVGTSST
jgi:hypothetical protein